jgi:hypothetical protein
MKYIHTMSLEPLLGYLYCTYFKVTKDLNFAALEHSKVCTRATLNT